MPAKLPVYYWDTCIFLEHFRGEKVTDSKRRAIKTCMSDNKEEKNRIVASAITHAEVLPRRHFPDDASKEAIYWSFFNGVYVIDFDVDRQVISLAREIRDFYYLDANPKTATPYRMLGMGDSIHLATAIIVEADEFYTRDGRRSGGNLPILGLEKLTSNGKIANRWDLKIVNPEEAQADLLDSITTEKPN